MRHFKLFSIPCSLFPNFQHACGAKGGFYVLKNLLCCMKCEIYPFRTHFKLQTPNSKLQTKNSKLKKCLRRQGALDERPFEPRAILCFSET